MTTSGPEFGIPAALTPSDGPSTVQDDIDELRPVSTAAHLETLFPAVGGVHTIDRGVVFKLPAGATEINFTPNKFVCVYPAGFTSEGAQPVLRSDIDGTFVSGEINADNVAFMNASFGPNAKVMEGAYTGGRPFRLKDIGLIGQRPGSITDPFGGGIFQQIVLLPLAPNAESFVFTGTIGPVTGGSCAARSQGSVAWTAFSVPLGASVVALDFENMILVSADPGDRLFEFDAGMTIPATSIIVSERSRVQGPGEIYAPGFNEKSPEVIARGTIGGDDSQWLANAAFDGGGTDIIVTHHATPGVGVVMPSQNVGPTAVLTERANQERFDLDIISLQVWSLKGTGRTDNRLGRPAWFVTVKRSGGAAIREHIAWVERWDGATWEEVPGSRSSDPIDNRYVTLRGEAYETYDANDEFRLLVASDESLATDSVSAYGLSVFT